MLLLLALGGVVVRKTYYSLPLAELKRRAEKREQPAAKLYRAVAYGNSLRSLLWLYTGLASAGSIILLSRFLPVWASLLIVGPVLWLAFSWLPASRTSRLGTRLTLLVTPVITWLLNYLHPVLSRSADIIEKRYTIPRHTGIFEREDFLKLVERQTRQPDNRLSAEELEIVMRALTFGDYKVVDVLTPRKEVKTVLKDETIGPILIDELHKASQVRIPIKDSPKGGFAGILLVSKLSLKTSGHVRDIMDPTVYYLHEDDSLSEALHAFFVTNYPLFVVVNSFEEYVGVVTIENVMRQLLGHMPGDDFDQYANPVAVAARHSQKPEKLDTDEDIVILDES